ncbi:peptidoglycan-binding domain-containing protein [Streptomyces sp. NRRL F-5122]|uniref:peptidoglycan-binding domain-containing protein n=1 Tax=Streptomyces sp. NRRL F-5122 TaxID=1609098 RepID=UPI00099F3083|nr:peptidoglycan-binding domain-containing protein [Streptomyces sp. NRRL F-5122]
MRLKRAIAAAAAAVLLPLGGAVAMAAPAAATGPCSGSTWFNYGGYWHRIPTTSDNSGNRQCHLQQGLVGGGVGELQRNLNRCYNQGLALDSNYGPATARAVRNVQSRLGISVDGIFGPQTSSAMVWAKFDSAGNYYGC